MRLSVVGLGKLGAPLAVCLAAQGFRVLGVDVAPGPVEAIRRGEPPVFEPGLREAMFKAGDLLSASSDLESAVAESDVTLIVVPTPSEASGGFSLEYVLAATEGVGSAVRKKREYHCVVLMSTVSPGASGGPVRSLLEASSGRPVGDRLGLCYSPEFIALGSVIRDLTNPSFVLIGEFDQRAGDALTEVYARLCDNHPPVARMSLINAEIAKLAVNAYVTTKISYANTLAELCERLPGGDVDVVTSAVGLDPRIGETYLRGGLAFGGPCFPRDSLALASVARSVHTQADLAIATDAVNRHQHERLLRGVLDRSRPGEVVCILGLAYKPHTNVVDQAPGFRLAQALLDRGIQIHAFDPAVAGEILEGSHALTVNQSLEEALRGASVIVVATTWPAFQKLPREILEKAPRRPVIIDCWRMLEPEQYNGVADYVALGRFPGLSAL